MSIVILGLVGLVIMLASFLLITRRSPPDLVETPSNKAWDTTPLPSYAPSELPAYEQPAPQAPAQPEPFVEQPVVNQGPAQPEPFVEQPVVNQGPPLPATGLPAGWTMEQWAYYGEQYLAANQAPAPTYQPTPSMTSPSNQDTNLSDLLDDLDL